MQKKLEKATGMETYHSNPSKPMSLQNYSEQMGKAISTKAVTLGETEIGFRSIWCSAAAQVAPKSILQDPSKSEPCWLILGASGFQNFQVRIRLNIGSINPHCYHNLWDMKGFSSRI